MVQASRSRGLRSNDDAQPSDGVVLHGYLERFVTTSGKDDLGRRLCFLGGVMVMAAGSVSWEIAQHLEMSE